MKSVAVLCLVVAACSCDYRAHSEALRPDDRGSDDEGPVAVSLFEPSANQSAKLALLDSLGPSERLLEIRAYPERWVVQGEDPKHPGQVLQWQYEGGTLGRPQALMLRGNGDLEQNLFTLDEVRLEALPELAQRAVRHVDPENGRVGYVHVRRNLPVSREIVMRAFVHSPGLDGQLDADRLGRPLGD